MRSAFFRFFDLRPDQDDAPAIDAAIRKGARLGGTSLWILMFAIVIASIGLNVNSTTVVIGAMLISPLMGPIVGPGYGAGINDSALIRQSLRNLAVFVAISLATSALYFLVSPLSEAQSELLARTTPTLWDVLIAFFGGAAGIVALTRRDGSTVVPGVAIATALMPPLCTAGYGLASGNPAFFLGAFYLFSINSVFIAFATLVFVKLLKLPQHVYPDPRTRHRNRLLIGAAVLATLLPSAWLAYRLVADEVFSVTARRLVAQLEADPRFVVLAQQVSPPRREIALTLGGNPPPPNLAAELEDKLAGLGQGDGRVRIRHAGHASIDLAALKRDLQQEATARRENAAQRHPASNDAATLSREIRARLPEATDIAVARGEVSAQGDAASRIIVIAVIAGRQPLAQERRDRLADWLKSHLPREEPRLFFEP